MNRMAAFFVLAAAPFLMGAEVTVKAALDGAGRGKVYMCLTADLEQSGRFARIADERLRDLFLVRALRASSRELTDLLAARGFAAAVVEQKVDKDGVRTEVTAEISDVRPLAAIGGGEVSFTKKPGNFMELNGALGGELAGTDADLSALAPVSVTIWTVFRGTVREADNAARISHTADSVTWRWRADRMLARATAVHVRVLPRIEENPQYWLALILAVTALVVVGALIVLGRGREAMK